MAGKVVLVTGAAGGLGRAVVNRLASEGANIVAVDIEGSWSGLVQLKADVEALGRRAVVCCADVRDSPGLDSAVDAGVAELGRLDAVVANAGVMNYSSLAEMPDDVWTQTIDINLTGVWRTAKASLPHMNDGGSIVFTSSTAALRGYARVGHYVAAKHGLTGLMRTLAQEVADRRIRVNTVNPGQMNTSMINNPESWHVFVPDVDEPTIEDLMAALSKNMLIPTPWVEPEDVANAILFLTSDESRFVTGVTLPIDAGALMK